MDWYQLNLKTQKILPMTEEDFIDVKLAENLYDICCHFSN